MSHGGACVRHVVGHAEVVPFQIDAEIDAVGEDSFAVGRGFYVLDNARDDICEILPPDIGRVGWGDDIANGIVLFLVSWSCGIADEFFWMFGQPPMREAAGGDTEIFEGSRVVRTDWHRV